MNAKINLKYSLREKVENFLYKHRGKKSKSG